MAWVNIELMLKQCEELIKNNPQLKISKVENKRGNFVFYRKYNDKEYAEFRLCLVLNEDKNEGWSIDFMRHTGKWSNLSEFGSFEHCLNIIKKEKYEILKSLNDVVVRKKLKNEV